ncbi:MAG: DUF1684 domain-containing protein [Spirosomaceae bacterium]|nr:DUF1684 domain-containing protein [Spirosomataceae bacterium]
MLKNKWFAGGLFVVLIITLYYSLSTELPFAEGIERSREDYKQTILSMEDSPINLDTFEHFEYFDPNESFVVQGEFIHSKANETFTIMMTDSTQNEIPLAGIAKLVINGKAVELKVFDEGETYLLPFNDKTNTISTYGGGRYINIEKRAVNDDEITVDFNKAHNFYCNYNVSYICPLPPRENFIDAEITAGEKTYGLHQHD